jgi:hypothetical protein
MIGSLQRIIQLAVVVAIGVLIYQPTLAPAPARPFFEKSKVWLLGTEPSWEHTRSLWQDRIEYVASYIPWIRSWFSLVPTEAPILTADKVVEFLTTIVLTRPLQKWETIKEEALVAPPATQSGTLQREASPAAEIQD